MSSLPSLFPRGEGSGRSGKAEGDRIVQDKKRGVDRILLSLLRRVGGRRIRGEGGGVSEVIILVHHNLSYHTIVLRILDALASIYMLIALVKMERRSCFKSRIRIRIIRRKV